jgi:hypothetical protein
MLKKLGKGGIAGIIVAIFVLAILGIILTDSEVGMATDIGIQEPVLSTHDFSSVPQAVIDDATKKAGEMAKKSQEKLQSLKDQLLATYVEAQKVDVVVFFNSGGMGWNLAKDTPGWGSILEGIQNQLKEMGYTPLVLNYRRTSSGVMGTIKEVIEAATRYPHKAKDLAARIEFLTENLPELKVIIAGESTGTVISEETMSILKDKSRVYSIQTGTPFWHRPTDLEGTLLINSNGRGLDTFSKGNIPAMIWATVKSWFGLASPTDNPGDILTWLKAPGHDYSWQYPGVYSAIVEFLDNSFGKKD